MNRFTSNSPWILSMLAILLMACSFAPIKPDSNNKEKNQKQAVTGDSLVVKVQILNSLPIGWGTKYSCKVIETIRGNPDAIDSTFILSASVGSENIYENIHMLNIGERFLLLFVKSDRKSTEPYIPAGTTGFMDKANIIWDLFKIEKVN
jgi:hypothetical protein